MKRLTKLAFLSVFTFLLGTAGAAWLITNHFHAGRAADQSTLSPPLDNYIYDVPFSELVKHGERYNGKLIRTQAMFEFRPHASALRDLEEDPGPELIRWISPFDPRDKEMKNSAEFENLEARIDSLYTEGYAGAPAADVVGRFYAVPGCEAFMALIDITFLGPPSGKETP
jgi:hypothetical protein